MITYRTGSSVEAVEESGSGLVVERGNIQELAEAILEIPASNSGEKSLYDCDENQRYREYTLLYNDILKTTN